MCVGRVRVKKERKIIRNNNSNYKTVILIITNQVKKRKNR